MKVKNFLPLIYFILGLSLVIGITGYATEGDVTSSVSIDGLRILADTFDGSTTNFDILNSTQIQVLNDMILEKLGSGKVVFNESVNLTYIAGADRTVDFDTDFTISSNLVSIDDPDLPGLDKVATIYIYGLSFTDPQIINGATECSDCTLISYSGGILIFNTTSLNGAYYARETPTGPVCGNGICESGETTATCPADCPADPVTPGGGGGSSGTTTIPTITVPVGHDFYVEPDFFNLKMNRGEYFQKNLEVVNNGTQDLGIYVIVSGLSDFIFPQTHYIEIKAGENYTLRLDIYISKERPTDVYIGKILFKTTYITRETNAILDIKESRALFDIRTDILKKYVNPGGRVRANISIINMGDLRNFDVSLEYKIIDFDNNNYTIKKQDFAINHTYFNIFYLDVPKDLAIGDYVFYARVNFEDVGASSFDTFTLEKVSWLAWLITILVIIVLGYLIVRRLRRDKRLAKRALKAQKQKTRVTKPSLIRRKLRVPRLNLR